ncbi:MULTISPECIES: 2-C-methyl-D-erythritol 4-phosphate cytidylyltransferase [unclassified Roseateles]|uniref:2-C-methyl-D-erythritol 4-phosphate cytidylyltransferase n=1 Tax=unclassified Roseateles TaxID=2626991 RepID=UPI0006FF6003|nr:MULTISPECIES: 2-C-methyl-D-erythritol 4-phosphate cytidylyltransferase [unclassified Roseateles]KQW44946.1 2-C-methyl-D-erythritol 4-phosphate cytidylyltransferase [Pelomonas sp. Root405]KRA70306.1 2-C-methyl-D-erythritol 4-phosphate cytidylyltransferase [Pelomonas sp. Root662]
MSPARFFALVPAAGIGERSGAGMPKQYVDIAGQPMLAHTLAALAAVPRIAQTLVVLSPDDDAFEAALPDWGGWAARVGGASRADSVLGGLAELRLRGAGDEDWVLVHDAARCLLRPAWVDALIDACEHDAVGGLLAQPVADTLKAGDADARVAATVDRRDKWAAQTPQMFRLGLLEKALRRTGAAATDEASAVEALGLAPRLVRASMANFKVTWPEDFALAALWLGAPR